MDVEATQTVDIMNFVSIDDVDPLLFYKPYYLEAAKGGDKAYVLLRDALVDSGKIAIAKVVIRTRQHLAAVKPQKKGLMLELMHFPEGADPTWRNLRGLRRKRSGKRRCRWQSSSSKA